VLAEEAVDVVREVIIEGHAEFFAKRFMIKHIKRALYNVIQ